MSGIAIAVPYIFVVNRSGKWYNQNVNVIGGQKNRVKSTIEV